MSAYQNLLFEFDTMICTICGTESFAWLAEVFLCPVCGEFKYAFPVLVSNSCVDEGEANNSRAGGDESQSKKRKRSLSNDGDTKQH